MRKKYYHAATPETMEKIIADGVVKRGWDGCVYLCEKPQDAAKFVAIRGHDEVAVIEVILPANKVTLRESDMRKRTLRRGRKKRSDTRFRCLTDAPKKLPSTNAKKIA